MHRYIAIVFLILSSLACGIASTPEIPATEPSPDSPTHLPSPTWTPTGFVPPVITSDQTPQPQGLPTETPTPIPDALIPADGVPQPVVEFFTIEGADPGGVKFGDTVTARWKVSGGMVINLCYKYRIDDPYPLAFEGGECFIALPGDGEQIITLQPYTEDPTFFVHFQLTALSGQQLDPDNATSLSYPIKEVEESVYYPLPCPYDWFMETPPTDYCPIQPVEEQEAVGQFFENGLMIFLPYENSPSPSTTTAYTTSGDGQPTIYSFYNIPPTEPTEALEPPPDIQLPDNAFWTAWYEGYYRTAPMRGLVGWAVEPPVTFTYAYQCEESPAITLGEERCFWRGPDNRIYVNHQGGTAWALFEK